MTDSLKRRRGRVRDRADVVAFRRDAPQDERGQALGELQKTYMPTASDLAPMGHLREFLSMAQQQLEEEDVSKAMQSYIVPNPSSNARDNRPGMRSVKVDEFTINLQGEYWERPGLMSPDSMRSVCEQVPVLGGVVLTRIRQVQRFCSVSESGNDLPGFEIRHADKDHHLSKSEQEHAKQLNRFITNCGWEFNPSERKKLGRDSFAQFMAKATRDTLMMDAMPIEREMKRDRQLGVAGFYPVDGATVRLCTERGYQGNQELFALQVVEGRICTAYTHEDLIYEVRNPRTSVRACGYGQSEVEFLIKVVTGYLNAMTYNIKGFDSNAIPKGMMHLVGKYEQKDIVAFKRYWNAMVKGINNTWAMPIMVSPDEHSKASFEKFDVEFNEMYFAKWMTFLTSLICAIFGISPAEINFDSFSGGNTSPLAGSDTEEKLVASKDSGLRPLLMYFQNLISDFVLGQMSDSMVFRFTGLDPEDLDKRHERIKLTATVDEMRARDGQPKHPNPILGNAPVNPALMQVYMADLQAKGQVGAPQGSDNDEEPDEGTSASASAGKRAGPTPRKPPAGDLGKSFGLPVYQVQELIA